jgi:hypothetical protein
MYDGDKAEPDRVRRLTGVPTVVLVKPALRREVLRARVMCVQSRAAMVVKAEILMGVRDWREERRDEM